MESNISKLLQLEHNCRNCENIKELYFQIVNETRNIVPYSQGVLLTTDLKGKYKVVGISDISVVDSTSPYVQWIENVVEDLNANPKSKDIFVVEAKNDLKEVNYKSLLEYAPPNLLFMPLISTKEDSEVNYIFLLFKESNWIENDILMLKHLSSSLSYFLFAMRSCGILQTVKRISFKNKYFKIILILLFILMFLPVQLSILAPLEVDSKNPYVVTSPLNAIIKDIKVYPNDKISKNQLIVEFDDVDFKNNYLVSKRTLDVANAELFTVKQSSFMDPKQKSQISQLENQVELKEAELNFAKDQLDKTKIYAKEEGIAIINNPNDWKGKPVNTGERIFLIANPNSIELKIMLPVSDAIFLEENAIVKAFFDNDPTNSWKAKVKYISYKPELTEQNVLSYKIIAQFDDINENGYIPSIGLRGTAKIYSKQVSLFFYLFRKPITATRQWIGW
ncbi:efflux RND transporter periplasmic adaptor subunit [Aliarcobacter cibarius]|uniref:Efflux RND transporter periplasmic adaptor subunit n=1 Tax=Aliarcobacter cibarius TaxID=255507 RepID=A0A7L5JLS9_9BACT|nr:HlyD family efflux transporter periplasmic adaptor subunit [Aliarcobacter cibarius]QKJ26070.1 RND family efflux system, membrane fusion protein [Aliarcobacter cibarius]TLS96140.1 efflux RND transporter periplasmic adaptor subunit [Aliarcobacter cibarius]TLS97083.1 efflux RND transporter periplasmic adaptor subunit [Aliarcobacter cibarius]TLT02379.1 efflux RND transporter periplasmic adaptor subunit [Aliarcobacter cibarius]